MTRFLRPALLASILLIAACGGDGKIDNDLRLRFIQAMPDAPLVEYRLGNSTQDVLDYRDGTRFLPLTPATYDVVINANMLDAEIEAVFDEALPLSAGIDYTLVAMGRMAGGSPVLRRFENPLVPVTTGYGRLQFLHAAPEGPPVDVYLTAPDAELAASTPVATLAFGEDLPRQEFLAGTWQLRLTAVGDPGELLYDSGTFPLSSSADVLMTAAVNVGTGPSPFVVFIHNGFSTQSWSDVRSVAEVRVVHVSPDTPPIDVTASRAVAEGETNDEPPTTLADALSYTDVTGYVELTPFAYTVEVSPAGVVAQDPYLEFGQILTGGQRITITVVGLQDSMSRVIIADTYRQLATAGQLVVYHAAPAAGTLDVYLRLSGTAPTEGAPTWPGMALGTSPGSGGQRSAFVPGNYTLTLTEAGTKTVVTSVDIPLQAGSAFTAIVRDTPRLVQADTGKPIEVILIEDAPPLVGGDPS